MFEWYPLRIPETGLSQLHRYKYRSVDLSPVSKYIMQPYWTWASTLVPIWMAPNLITLIGFICVVVNYILIMIYMPDLPTTTAPNLWWIYLSSSIGIFLYSTMDNIDGKQARKTNTSSPLGEVFDHGIDALNCVFGGVLQAAGIGSGCGWYLVWILFMTTTTFYVSAWETYYTGCLHLGYINGPTEGLIIAMASLIVSFVYGPAIWWTPINSILPASIINLIPPSIFEIVPPSTPIVTICLTGMFMLLIFTQIPGSVYRVVMVCQNKGVNGYAAIWNMVEFVCVNVAMVVWMTSNGSALLKESDLMNWVVGAWGSLFGRMSATIIVAHVTKQPYPSCWITLLPIYIGACVSRIPELAGIPPIFTAQSERIYVVAMTVAISIEYFVWCLTVIEQICSELGIQCLRIPYKKNKDDPVDQTKKDSFEKKEKIDKVDQRIPATPRRSTRLQSRMNSK